MKNLRESFENIYNKYRQKKDKFKTVIDRWGKNRLYKKSYRQGLELFNTADQQAEILLKNLASGKNSALTDRIKGIN